MSDTALNPEQAASLAAISAALDDPLSQPYPLAARAASLAARGRAEEITPTITDLVRCSGLDNLVPPVDPAHVELGLRQLASQTRGRGLDALALAGLKCLLIDRFKRLKIPRPVALVTAAFPDAGAPEPSNPSPVLVRDDDPWPEPVNGSQLLDQLLHVVQTHVVLSFEAAVAVVLWAVHTFAMDAWSVSPLLTASSPTKRSGKTTLLLLLSGLARKSFVNVEMTPAGLFRLIEAEAPTLIMDEADCWLTDEKSGLRGLVNAGHTRETAFVLRCVGDSHELRLFRVWAPKAIGLIGRPADTLVDRSIVIPMKRKTAADVVGRLRLDRLSGTLRPLRQQARRWTADHLDDLRAADPDLPEVLHDRAQDNWRPLISVADQVGGPWPTRARDAALVLSGHDEVEDGSLGLQALADLAAIFEAHAWPDLIETTTLINDLVQMAERPWADYRHGKPLNAHGLARLLRGFEVVPTGKVRMGARTTRGYRLAGSLLDAFLRYVPGFKAEQRNKPSESGEMFRFAKRNPEPECSTCESGTKPMNPGECSAVPLSVADVGSGQVRLIFEEVGGVD